MTQPTACLLDGCARACTTECREAINRTWRSLRGDTAADRPTVDSRHTVDNLINRAERGGLTGDEAAKLRDSIGQLYARVETAERRLATLVEVARRNSQRAAKAEAALDAIRAVHRPARDWSWKPFGCDHHGAHAQPCGHCGTCYPCPTVAALDAHTNPKDQT